MPIRIVTSVKLASRLRSRALAALLSPAAADASSRRRLRLKTAMLQPENRADWEMQKAIPSEMLPDSGEQINNAKGSGPPETRGPPPFTPPIATPPGA